MFRWLGIVYGGVAAAAGTALRGALATSLP
jgi:hypothetical protein